jgi:hypothetical protein
VIVFAFPQVRALRLSKAMFGQVFEKNRLPAPPAGFEPAHTAPEGNGADGCDQAERVMALVIGSAEGAQPALVAPRATTRARAFVLFVSW